MIEEIDVALRGIADVAGRLNAQRFQLAIDRVAAYCALKPTQPLSWN